MLIDSIEIPRLPFSASLIVSVVCWVLSEGDEHETKKGTLNARMVNKQIDAAVGGNFIMSIFEVLDY